MNDMKDRIKTGIDTAADKAKSFTERAAGAASDPKATAHGVIEGVKDRAQQAVDVAGDKVQEWAGDAKQTAEKAGAKVEEWAGDAYHATTDTMGDFGKEVSSMVRKYPVPALLVGFGLGLILGRAART